MFFETTRKWSTYDDEEYSFVSSDFAHDTMLKMDLRYKTEKGRIQVEEKIDFNKSNNLSSFGEVKFEFPIPNSNKTIFSRLSSTGKALISYDNGLL